MRLRPLELKDAEQILKWMTDVDIMQNFRLPQEVRNLESIKAFITHSFEDFNRHFAIVDMNDCYMGTISLKNISSDDASAEYAVVLNREFIGKGIGVQATKLVLDYAFRELQLYRVYLNVLSENERAQKKYEKIGFKLFCSTNETINGEKRTLKWYEINATNRSRPFFKLIDLKKNGNETGYLVSVQSRQDIPFDMQRLFYIYGIEQKAVRGNHANKQSEFVFICISGSCCIDIDDGNYKKSVLLDSPERALYLDKMTWKAMYNFSADAVLLVLANTVYDPDEYIYDYAEFLVSGIEV